MNLSSMYFFPEISLYVYFICLLRILSTTMLTFYRHTFTLQYYIHWPLTYVNNNEMSYTLSNIIKFWHFLFLLLGMYFQHTLRYSEIVNTSNLILMFLVEYNIDQFYAKHHFLINCTAMFTIARRGSDNFRKKSICKPFYSNW